jgi:hypothetical protein
MKLELLCGYFFAFLVSLNFGVQKHAMSSQFEVLQVLFENFRLKKKTPLKLEFKLYFGCLFKLLALILGKLCTQLVIIIFFCIVHFHILDDCQKLPRISLNNLTLSYLIIEIFLKP